jgi:nucleotide-binding universal stress UspA family protein
MNDQGPILVPLDGSELAEGALAYASVLAHALRTHLVLVTVWEGTSGEFGKRFPERVVELDESANEQYTTYLHGVRDRLQQPETRVLVRGGDASTEILRAADETGARMIVLTTHGRGGIRRWAYGSNLSKIVAGSQVPVLSVGPHALERTGDVPAFARVLVPVDGSRFSEAALPVATHIAAALQARLSVVRIIPWAVQLYPYTAAGTYVPELDSALEAEGADYVSAQVKALGAGVDGYTERGDPADRLMEFIEHEHVDLVVMSTHGRSGLARLALGSTADRLLQSRAPVLLIRPSHEQLREAETEAKETARA